MLYSKNTLCTVCLRVWEFHAMPVFICNILEGASVTQFWVRLLEKVHLYRCFVDIGGKSGGVNSAWWHIRTALKFCFIGLVVGRNYVWCLVIVVIIFMGFGQAGAKRQRCLSVIIWRWRCKSQKGDLFIEKAGSHKSNINTPIF